MAKDIVITKPTPPLPPKAEHYLETDPSSFDRYCKAYTEYEVNRKKYLADLHTYEQYKLLRLVRNSSDKYCLEHIFFGRK
jgi:hypothetical protein